LRSTSRWCLRYFCHRVSGCHCAEPWRRISRVWDLECGSGL